jgi:dihydroxyacetone kinase
MVPAAAALEEAAGAGRSLTEALRGAAVAARLGADATAAMTPKKGRATYLGDRAVGEPDAGAAAVALWWEAAPVQG